MEHKHDELEGKYHNSVSMNMHLKSLLDEAVELLDMVKRGYNLQHSDLWLTAVGMKDILTFLAKHKEDK